MASTDMASLDDVPEPEDFCIAPEGAAPEVGPDQVDEFIEAWRLERPDLDLGTLGALGCFARMKWLTKNLAAMAEQVMRRHGLNAGEFDVLAALRRSGPRCTLIPSQLSALLMMSRAGMTNRLDRLEAAGLVERALDPADRRSFRVRLTDKGRAVIDAAVTEHAQLVNRLDAVLSPDQRASLDEALRALLRAFP
ncbi:MarR family winged helix-turn-helix transcriptional regulator [Pseudofrankia sp. BMG5.37]|uniref:MarR family winged helix-turn-helix transcriptional regulator n=1 Tax=Pseudofrankia sp. BMG5.37 TaxID=3050035 RepID=UPI0037C5332B